jgi:hypothetical protein
MRAFRSLAVLSFLPGIWLALPGSTAPALEFETVVLNADSTYSAAAVSDIDGDGDLDVLCGGWWYEFTGKGLKDWKRRFVREVAEIGGRFDGYSHLPIDMDGDGDEDFINVNYRSKSIYWVERPDSIDLPWPKHTIALPGSMENGALVDVDGDGIEDILPNGAKFAAWFRGMVVTESPRRLKFEQRELIPELIGHGLGHGDLNGDGRMDLVGVSGWAEAPEDRLSGEWKWHGEFHLEKRASVPVIVSDVEGDGDADLVWSSAHDYGVFWLEQNVDADGNRSWKRHVIDMSWSQGHTPHWADLDGDGIGEFVCGKRYYAHDGKDPGADDPLVIYSYQYDRDEGQWERRTVSEGGRVGWGLSPTIADVDGDGDLDLVCPGRSGLHLLVNRAR